MSVTARWTRFSTTLGLALLIWGGTCPASDGAPVLSEHDVAHLEAVYAAGGTLTSEDARRLGDLALAAGRAATDAARLGESVSAAFDVAALAPVDAGEALRDASFARFLTRWESEDAGAERGKLFGVMWSNFRRPRVWMREDLRRGCDAQLARFGAALLEASPDDEARAMAAYLNLERLLSRTRDSSLTRLSEDERREAARAAERLIEDHGSRRPPGSTRAYAQLVDGHAYEFERLAVGARLPEVSGTALDGRAVALSDFRGKVVLVSGWATWCGPCIGMFPHEIALLAEHGDDGFAILGVNDNADLAKARAMRDEHGLTYRSLWSRSAETPATRTLGMGGLPSFFLLDPDGRIIARATGGGSAAGERLEEWVRDALREHAPGGSD